MSQELAESPRPGFRPDARVLAAIAVTLTAWTTAFVVIRWVGQSIGAGPLALGRLLVGSVALGLLVLARRSWVWPTRREWLLLVVCGLGWFTVYNVALNEAERHIDAGTTAMLVNVGPILIALLAGALLREGFPKWLLIGAFVAFFGVVLIGLATSNLASAGLLGILLALTAGATYAIGVVAQKPVLRRLPALQGTWLACTIGAIGCLPFTPGLLGQLAHAPLLATGGLLYLGLVPTSLAFSTWAYALARTDAGRLGVTTYLVPPLTITVSWLLLGEVPALLALGGGAVCLLGVALSRRH